MRLLGIRKKAIRKPEVNKGVIELATFALPKRIFILLARERSDLHV